MPRNDRHAGAALPLNLVQALQGAFAAYQRGDWPEAERLCRLVLDAQADNFDALHLAGFIAAQTQRMPAAAALLVRAARVNPNHPEVHNNLGNALRALGQPAQALASYERAAELQPAAPTAHYNRGVALWELQRYAEAVASYERALALAPDYAEACYNHGVALADRARFAQALASYGRALALNPDYAEAHNNRGVALWDLGQHAEALAGYERALALSPDYAAAHNNRGNALHELERAAQALLSYERALALQPQYADAWSNRGVALGELGRRDEALASCALALALNPGYADGYNNFGNALAKIRSYGAALASYERALALKPAYAEGYNNRGAALAGANHEEAAVASYGRALALKPDYADAYNNRANALRALKRYAEALDSYGRAMLLDPACEFVHGMALHTRMLICDWREVDAELAQLAASLERGEKASPPFPVLALSGSLALQRTAAEIYAQDQYPASHVLPALSKCLRHERIRVGYFSADFRNHAVSFLTAELFELHDKSKFELYAFSFGPDSDREIRQRLTAAFDKFIDVRAYSDQAVAQLARELEVDIAIDLGGFTENCRTGIFALRAAPVQASYLGYLGTMGAEYMDYLIADDTIVPAEHRKYYSEKIVYLPSYQANDSKRRISDKIYTRAELGLPRTGFVYCCFNNNYKITPETFSGWMRILQRVEGSVLLLYADNQFAADNLRREAAARGLDAARLIFGERLPVPEYLARYRTADLFLDTLPYNAGTTASDALWAGLPVLTRIGESFAGRVAASLLHAIHLPELITDTQEAYEALAVELATNPQWLAQIREKLARNRLVTPLFDTALFAQHIEAAYLQMYERHHAELPPEHIHVPAGHVAH